MKKIIMCLAFTLVVSGYCYSQEWMTSLDAAKRIALVQDKMLFMVWEDAAQIPYPVIVNDERGNEIAFANMFDHQEMNQMIWEYFVPVIVSEDLYGELYDAIKNTRTNSYIRQFEDDNIKVMDVNGMIINTSVSPEAYFNLTNFIRTYALNTRYLTAELDNYTQRKDFNTAFRLASKYFDYAILVDKKIREEILQVAIMYLDQADLHLNNSPQQEQARLLRKSELLRLSEYLLQDRPKKVLRTLKKIELSEMDETNTELLAFLYYTGYLLNNDKEEAAQWESKLSALSLKKSQLIFNIHQ